MRTRTVIILSVIFVSCKSNETMPTTTNEISFGSNAESSLPILVYKTKKDYSNLVPILLNDNKTQILSYPDPRDVKVGSYFLLPTSLQNGYLLDKKGIGENVAFLKYTYDEYSNLKTLPPLKELYKNIIDKNPLIELCDCGNKSKYVDLEKQLNEYINKDILRTKCKVLK